MYSQKKEDDYIMRYFDGYGSGFIGTLLDIGANDGVTLSNSRGLIEKGWIGDLVEPAAIPFRKLKQLYGTDNHIKLHEFAIDTKTDKDVPFYESGSMFSAKDSGLVSTIVPAEKKRWWLHRIKFTESSITTVDFATFQKAALYKKWDFISIDAEGKDWDILQQINLTDVECKCLCVEHNGVETDKYIDYAKSHGMSVLLMNNINVVLIKKINDH